MVMKLNIKTRVSERVLAHIHRSRVAAEAMHVDEYLTGTITDIARCMLAAFNSGNKLMICGNGGSAADAAHIAAEFTGRYKIGSRVPMAALALTTDTAAMSAIGNDFGFEHIYGRQVRALGKPGDVLLALSTSGMSANVLEAMMQAQRNEMLVIGFTMAPRNPMFCKDTDLIFAPDAHGSTAIAQQCHMIAAHAICDIVEEGFVNGLD